MLRARNKKIVIDERRQGSPGEKVENQMNKYKRVTNNTPGKKRSQQQARDRRGKTSF